MNHKEKTKRAYELTDIDYPKHTSEIEIVYTPEEFVKAGREVMKENSEKTRKSINNDR